MIGNALSQFRFSIRGILLCAGVFAYATVGGAQNPVVLNGLVTDSSGAPVPGAIVSLVGTALRATSDDRGEFRLHGVGQGLAEIRVRRIGFLPAAERTEIGSGGASNRVHVRLTPLPITLKPVEVRASRIESGGRLAGYYQRLQRRSGGYFIVREEIDKRSARTLSQLISQTPGMSSLGIRAGGRSVRMRGKNCRPLVWLDGVAMPAGEVDLDAFSVNSLHGIELYSGFATVPFDYMASRGQSNCGTILLWSRGKDTEPQPRQKLRIEDLERITASLSIFTADQVERQAELASPLPLEVTYPAALLAARLSGSVVAEFVVDTEGQIERNTVTIVSSTHPLFADAVLAALERARYSPAVREGVAVRQVVHQPFAFSAERPPKTM